MIEKPRFDQAAATRFANKGRDVVGSSLLGLMNIDVTGIENLDALNGRPAIFALFPHTSHLDAALVRYVLPSTVRHSLVFLAKKEYWNGNSILPTIAATLTTRSIPLPTSDNTVPLGAFKQARKLLETGHSIGISPEGTRTNKPLGERPLLEGTAALMYFCHGKFPIVPIVLKGPLEIWPKGQKFPHPFIRTKYGLIRKHISVHIDIPIYGEPKTEEQRILLLEGFREQSTIVYEHMPEYPISAQPKLPSSLAGSREV